MVRTWRKAYLGDVVEMYSGGTPRKETSEFWRGTIPWVSAKDMKQFRIVDTEDHVTELGVENGTRLVPAGTVLVLSRGMTLLNDVPICVAKRPMAFNQDVRALRPKSGVREDFLPYLLLGNKKRLLAIVDLAGHGTGRLNSDALKGLEVSIPPQSEQKAIAQVLGALDEKLELNRLMNETLEAIARAIFNSWFIDFDPVRAKEGRWRKGESLPSLPACFYDLFPDQLWDSELGEIPTGWRVARLGDVAELAYGKALKEENRKHGSIPVFGSNGQVGWHNERLVEGPGIVVGRKGNPGLVTWSQGDFYAIDTAFYILRNDCCRSLYFLYCALDELDLGSLGADSAVPGLNRNIAHMSVLLIPPPAVLDVFDNIIRPIFRRRYENENQSRTLALLRDTILPKLISGELCLSHRRGRNSYE